VQPTLEDIKEDLRILHAMHIKVLKTFNVHFAETSNLLKVIRQLKAEDSSFEMYVMLGAWINCENAWTTIEPNHDREDVEGNTIEMQRAVALANTYPDIVKMIAVGNEAMVHWATSYYVRPEVILKWVNHLQDLKREGKLPPDIWITSSDNFASWGGGDSTYHHPELDQLIEAVDFISMHTYPYLDTYHNGEFWGIKETELELTAIERIEMAVGRAQKFAEMQYKAVSEYVHRVAMDKPIHIGETGWATVAKKHFGTDGSKATDEYKQALYYRNMMDWAKTEKITCFFFEAFDEPWKDYLNPDDAENHFGLFTVDGQAKYALWDMVDQGVFDGLTRNRNPITKTFNGNRNTLLSEVDLPDVKHDMHSAF
jgi:exo-beta-1,3-glucanase (GH17 family)